MANTVPSATPGADRFAIVAAVNDEDCLARNLARSAIVARDEVEVVYLRGARSMSTAYNDGLDQTNAEYVIFAHQDVYLPEPFFEQLRAAIHVLSTKEPDWGVLGVFGVDMSGRIAGSVWSSGLGRTIGGTLPRPCRAQSLDELVLVVRRGSGCRFDPELPHFHLYGTDIVLTARSQDCGSWVAELPVVHNSVFVRDLGPGFRSAYRYMRRKWWNLLPVRTPVLWLTRAGFALLFQRLKMWRTQTARAARSMPAESDPRMIARQCGYE